MKCMNSISVLKQKYKPWDLFTERSCTEVCEHFHQGACPVGTVERILKNFSTRKEVESGVVTEDSEETCFYRLDPI